MHKPEFSLSNLSVIFHLFSDFLVYNYYPSSKVSTETVSYKMPLSRNRCDTVLASKMRAGKITSLEKEKNNSIDSRVTKKT